MEYVKEDCSFEEIGGVYIPNANKVGWKLVTNDNDVINYVLAHENDDVIDFWIDNVADEEIPPMDQNQPHVIVRPRKCILTGSSNPPKRNVFMLKSAQQQHHEKPKEKKCITEKSKVKANDKLGVKHVGEHDSHFGEDDMSPFKARSYEQIRSENIEANNERLTTLGLSKLSVELDSCGPEKKRKRKLGSLKEGHQKTKAMVKKTKEASRPKTRSRSNVHQLLDENECVVPTSTQIIIELVKKCTRKKPLKDHNELRNGEIGSMSAYLALKKKRQTIEVRHEEDSIDMQDAVVQHDNAEMGQEGPKKITEENQREKKCRGPTRMF
ncbi:unnamed protein product, partial [Cuscuta epithymum]